MLLIRYLYVIDIFYEDTEWVDLKFKWWNKESSQTYSPLYYDSTEESKNPNLSKELDGETELIRKRRITNCKEPDKIKSEYLLLSVDFSKLTININWNAENQKLRYFDLLNLIWSGMNLQLFNFSMLSKEFLQLLITMFESNQKENTLFPISWVEFISSSNFRDENDIDKKLKAKLIQIIQESYPIILNKDFEILKSLYCNIYSNINDINKNSIIKEESKLKSDSDLHWMIKYLSHNDDCYEEIWKNEISKILGLNLYSSVKYFDFLILNFTFIFLWISSLKFW